MNRLHIRALDNDRVSITGIPPLVVMILRELPETLKKRDIPQIRKRLFPPLTRNNEKDNQEWKLLMEPELHQLFASAGEIVIRDLDAIQASTSKEPSFRIHVPAKHLNAWISALNEARLILGEEFGVTEQDMNQQAPDIHEDKGMAVLRISALGWLLGHLIDFVSGGSTTEQDGPTP